MPDLFALPLIAFLALVLGFGFLIFVHELGHFLVARWVGIRCTQFAIGFGPSMLTWRKGLGIRFGGTEAEYEKRLAEGADPASLGETEYRLNWIPLGGYVKMLGQEDLDPAATSQDPRSYNAKPIWARMCVISAGVVMNLIFGLLFFIVAFMAGVDFPDAVVGGVTPGSPAESTYAQGHEENPAYQGLKIGDRITAVNGRTIEDLTEVRIATALGRADTPVVLSVQREGEAAPLTYAITPRPDRQDNLLSAGIHPASTLQISAIDTASDLYAQGLRPDMQVVAVNGQPTATLASFHRAFRAGSGEPVRLSLLDPKGDQAPIDILVPVRPTLVEAPGGQVGLAGLVPVTEITLVAEGSPAAGAGVQPGDLLMQLGGANWPDVTTVFQVVQGATERGEPVPLQVWRAGQRVDLGPVHPAGGRLGIGLAPAWNELRIGAAPAGSPAAALNFPAGSRIDAIDGQPVADWADLQRALQARTRTDDLGPVTVALSATLPLGGAEAGLTETRTLELSQATRDELVQAAWLPDMAGVALYPATVTIRAANPWQATVLGAEKTRQFMLQTYVTLLRLFQGTVKVSHLRGPVGIVDEGTRVAQRGWPYLLFFLGLISVNLAVLNFLPLPVVDGGHMVLLLIEKLKGSPASPAVQQIAMLAGLALIGVIFLVVTYNDILRLLTT